MSLQKILLQTKPLNSYGLLVQSLYKLFEVVNW